MNQDAVVRRNDSFVVRARNTAVMDYARIRVLVGPRMGKILAPMRRVWWRFDPAQPVDVLAAHVLSGMIR